MIRSAIITLFVAFFLADTILAASLGDEVKPRVRLPPQLQAVFVKLHRLIHSPREPKGTPFPPFVSKPSPYQRVAIVGAGLAGLHMAYLLKKQGFNNVIVLEKDSRVGGKVLSEKHNGFVHEMGACYTSPDYITNVYALAKELGVDDFVPTPPSTIWFDKVPQPLLLSKFILIEVMRFTHATSLRQAVGNLIDATYRYTVLHRGMFGKYTGDLMFKPSRDVLSKLNKTLLTFLTEHKLLALVPVLTAANTMQGYGHIDRVSALYGMMWDTPNLLTAMLARSLGLNKGGVDMFRNGFMQLTDRLAAMANVKLNVNIKTIKRDSTGITIKFSNDTHREVTENFDFLIWAADAREALRVLDRSTLTEKSFSNLRNTWFTTTLFDSTEQCKSLTPVEYWISNVYNKREHSVWARRNDEFIVTGKSCNRTKGVRTYMSTVSYQMGDASPLGTCEVNRKFKHHFISNLGAQDVKIIKAKTWNYFPRFSVKQLADGILWKIVEHQGERGTWFVGSSVSFESAKSVIEYNKQMMERMKL